MDLIMGGFNKKILLIILFCFFISSNFCLFASEKKILIFSCSAGNGHIAATTSIKDYLQDKYECTVAQTYRDVLASHDIIRKLSFQKYTQEDLYNFLAKKGLISCVHFVGKWGIFLVLKSKNKLIKTFKEYVETENPDMIISVINAQDFALLEVARQKNIPFLVVTNDLDSCNYLVGIDSPDYEKFKYTIPFDDAGIRNIVAKANLKSWQIEVSGFPVRDDFFADKDKEKIRQKYNIPPYKKVIMVLMGGLGSKATYLFAKQIAKMDLPIHMIVCLGSNISLKNKIENLKLNPNVSQTVLGFTKEISDLMAISDLLISKPGPNSLAEALCMRVPIVLDGISKTLYWEKYNLEFVEKNKLGAVIRKFSDLENIIKNTVFNEENNKEIRLRMQKYPQLFFGKRIKEIVDGMLG